MDSFCNSFEEAPKGCDNLSAYVQYNNFRSRNVFSFMFLSIIFMFVIVILLIAVFIIFIKGKYLRNLIMS